LSRLDRALARALDQRRFGVRADAGRRDPREAGRGRRGSPARSRGGHRQPPVRARGGRAMIRCVALRKAYGSVVAVDDLDLEIAAGEVFGFLGPNGAGKTTTIRMMVGLLEPTSGTAVLNGHDIRTAPEAAKAVTGYVPDQPSLYDKLTGLEFVRFMGGLYAVEESQLAERGADLLEEFALLDRADELVETYSHGMKQRLTLAAALVHRPKILILDEPMVGMDPQGALALKRLLVALAAGGVTIFLSTHSL